MSNHNGNTNELSNPRLDHIIDTLVERRKLWLLPGLAALMMSWVYVYFVRSETYTATQSLIVRDDLLGQSLKPGQFDSLDQMKSAQETILEIARKPQVIRNALKKVGPSNPGWFGVSDSWPDDKTIEDVQASVGFSAPNGAEFGHTEVIVLSAKGSSRERAHDFIMALQDEIDTKIRQVRGTQLSSMKDELRIIRDSAKASLGDSSERLNAIEREVGADLPTLRALSNPQSGEGTMARTLQQIRSEKRQAVNELDSARNQRNTLHAANDNPDVILATSDELFKFQPALNRLKQELIKAQSSLAESVGRYERAHPTVQKHEEQVRTMHSQIHDELDSAERGLESRISLLDQKVQKLGNLEGAIQDTFNSLSHKRVDYQRLDEEVKKKTEVFNQAQSNLAAIQQLDLSETGVTLLTRVDAPQVSTRADGLGKTTTILGGGIAGFLAGFGLVLLLAPNPDEEIAQPLAAPPVDRRVAQPPVTRTQAPVAPRVDLANVDVTTTPSVAVATADPATHVVISNLSAPATAKEEQHERPLAEPVARASENTPTQLTEVVVTPIATKVEAATPVAPSPATPTAPSPATPTAPEQSAAASGTIRVTKRPSDAAVTNAAKPTLTRKQAIDDEINLAVARGIVQAPVPSADVRPSSGQEFTAHGSDDQPALSSNAPAATNNLSKNRGTGDSSGVPTAASILASLETATPIGGTATAPPVITPQQIRPQPNREVTSVDSPESPLADVETLANGLIGEEVVIRPVEAVKESSPVEPQRRSSVRPIEIIKQANAATERQPINSNLPDHADEPSPASGPGDSAGADLDPPIQAVAAALELSSNHASNPFLNNKSSVASDDDPSAGLARQTLARAKINAALKGTLPPVAPAPTAEDQAEMQRQPASTIPIPDQIRKLSESISSFAKPIARVKEDPKKDF